MLGLVLALLPVVSAASPFLGCMWLDAAGAQPNAAADVLQQAASMCLAASKKYTYYSASQKWAWCLDDHPAAGSWQTASMDGKCAEGDGALHLTSVAGAYPFRKCYKNFYFYDGPYNPAWQSGWSTGHVGASYYEAGMMLALGANNVDPSVCFATCRDIESQFAVWWPRNTPGVNEFWCMCTNNFNGEGGECTADSAYAHGLGGFVQPSATLPQKRQRQQRLDSAAPRLCPPGLQACGVPSGGPGYDCLETENELESCGGCLHGAALNMTAPVGIDCTTLPGVSEMGVSCKAGKCVVLECDDDWVLQDGVCLSK